MEKFKRYKNIIIILLLLIAGAIAIVVGKSLAVQGGIACLCWGIMVFVIAWVTKQRNDEELKQFDISVTEMLKDIATNEENSEYYGMVDIADANKMREKLIKKHRKQVVSCTVIGVILIITCILCIV